MPNHRFRKLLIVFLTVFITQAWLVSSTVLSPAAQSLETSLRTTVIKPPSPAIHNPHSSAPSHPRDLVDTLSPRGFWEDLLAEANRQEGNVAHALHAHPPAHPSLPLDHVGTSVQPATPQLGGNHDSSLLLQPEAPPSPAHARESSTDVEDWKSFIRTEKERQESSSTNELTRHMARGRAYSRKYRARQALGVDSRQRTGPAGLTTEDMRDFYSEDLGRLEKLRGRVQERLNRNRDYTSGKPSANPELAAQLAFREEVNKMMKTTRAKQNEQLSMGGTPEPARSANYIGLTELELRVLQSGDRRKVEILRQRLQSRLRMRNYPRVVNSEAMEVRQAKRQADLAASTAVDLLLRGAPAAQAIRGYIELLDGAHASAVSKRALRALDVARSAAASVYQGFQHAEGSAGPLKANSHEATTSTTAASHSASSSSQPALSPNSAELFAKLMEDLEQRASTTSSQQATRSPSLH